MRTVNSKCGTFEPKRNTYKILNINEKVKYFKTYKETVEYKNIKY